MQNAMQHVSSGSGLAIHGSDLRSKAFEVFISRIPTFFSTNVLVNVKVIDGGHEKEGVALY